MYLCVCSSIFTPKRKIYIKRSHNDFNGCIFYGMIAPCCSADFEHAEWRWRSINIVSGCYCGRCTCKAIDLRLRVPFATQVVMTTVEPRHRPAAGLFDAYEYTIHSHTYETDAIPAAKFSYDMSPIQIVVKEERRKWYHFLTTTCAIIGGVFTVAGIVDAILYSTLRLAKKLELGKQM